MNITKQLVASLKEATGAGLHACHKALKAVNGNIDAAIEELKKAGQKFAATKVNRATNQGSIIIHVSEDAKKAVMIKVTCETDFVANNEVFQNFSKLLTEQAMHHQSQTIEDLLNSKTKDGHTIEEARQAIVARVKENVQINQLKWLETSDYLGSYAHKGRRGALLELKGGNPTVAKSIAIHIVSTQSEDIAQLLKQEFYKDPAQTVGQYLAKEKAQVIQYSLFQL